MKVYLIGFMGCGKTTIGKALAKQTGFGFVDTDHLIEEREKKTVSEIFTEKGEAYFREQETRVLEEIAKRDTDLIVATGGGLPCHGTNMETMNGSGVTVYMKKNSRSLAMRLENGKHRRPLLRGMDQRELEQYIGTKLGEREQTYGRAKVVIDCDGVSDHYICGHLETIIRLTPNENK